MGNVRIQFEGIVAVGPPHPREGDRGPGPIFAIMPMGLRERARISEEVNYELFTNVHIPVVLANQRAVGRPADDYRKGYYIWYVLRQRLEFAFDPVHDGDAVTYYKKPKGAEKLRVEYVEAVSDMREVFPARSRLKPGVFDRRPSYEVGAQVFIPRGHVKGAVREDSPSDGVKLRYFPKRTPNEIEKNVAQRIVVDVDRTEKVAIRMFSLDSAEELDGLIFNATEDLTVILGNADPIDIATQIYGEPQRAYLTAADFARSPADVDFEHFYRILAGNDDGGALPIPFLDDRPPFMLRPCYTTFASAPAGERADLAEGDAQ